MQPESQAVDRFAPFRRWFERANLGSAAIEAFRYYYGELLSGETGMIPESEIEPVVTLPDSDHLEERTGTGRDELAKTAILKLNGGLGTGMGLQKAKSLLVAKNGLTFLDIIARQVLKVRERSGQRVPLVLMNSFSTHSDSLEALSAYPELDIGLPLAFLQNRVPKVLKHGVLPPESGPDDERNWTPPGHGDLYVALQTSGMLDALLDRGIEYLFVSNSDNLGAALDERILAYFASEELPFLMEVADRTEADRKGGHLARRIRDGRLILRESAQTLSEDAHTFQDVARHRYFNTNNIWLNLLALKRQLKDSGSVLKLPLIVNEKTLDPRDPASPPVYQLETAMGSAIEVFQRSGAIRVPRTRFAPVKLTSDLLTLWSDAYLLTPEYEIIPNPENRFGLPVVSLDQRYCKFVDALSYLFPHGAPSLVECRQLEVEGSVRFGRDVRVIAAAQVRNPGDEEAFVPDGTILTGEIVLH